MYPKSLGHDKINPDVNADAYSDKSVKPIQIGVIAR